MIYTFIDHWPAITVGIIILYAFWSYDKKCHPEDHKKG